MTDERKALHDQLEQTREEDIDRLVDFIGRFLHPLESPASEQLIFDPVPPGSKRSTEIDEQWQQAMSHLWAKQSEMITRSVGSTTVTRLGIDPNRIGKDRCGWSASGGESANFTATWFEGRVFNRLGMFHLKQQQVVTFERCHISETPPELIYKVRLLTAGADAEKELRVPI